MKDELKLLNSLIFEGDTFTQKDIKGLVPLEDLGIEKNFYGGRCSGVAKTDKDYLFIVLEDLKPIDLILNVKEYNKSKKEKTSENGGKKLTENEEAFEVDTVNPKEMTNSEIKKLLDEKNIEYKSNDTKDELLKKLNG